MAKDVITRFKLETTQYDSKIKNAAKELSDVAKAAKSAGADFERFTKDSLDAAKALGNISTSSTNAKDRAKELVGAFNDVARSYNQLTKEQQQSDFGRAMAQSLTQLQQRIRETKQEMQGLSGKEGGLFGDNGVSGMLQVFGGNLMTKAAGMVAGLGAEVVACMNESAELAKQAEGVQIAFARLGRGDILDGLREATHGTVSDLELMKAAVKFNDFRLPVEELGTMLAFAQQKAKDTGQSVDYMVDSIVTGLGRKSLMILDNLGLSASEVKEKMKQTGDMTKAVGEIIREQMAKAGDYVETAADRAAQANVELQNAMLELGSTMREVFGYNGWDEMATGIKTELVGAITFTIETIGKAKEALKDFVDFWGNFFGRKSLKGDNQKPPKQTPKDGTYYEETDSDGNLLTTGYYMNGKKKINGYGFTVTGHQPTEEEKKKRKQIGGSGSKVITEEKDDFTEIIGLIGNAEERVRDLQKQIKEAPDETTISILRDQLKDAQQELDRLNGKSTTLVKGFSGVTTNAMSAWAGAQKKSLGDTEVGSNEYTDISANIVDTETLSNLLQKATEEGLANVAENINAEGLWESILNGENIPDEVWESIVDEMNEALSELGVDPIKLDVDTGKVIKDVKKVEKEVKGISTAASTVSSVVGSIGQAFNSIEDPAAKVAGTVAQAIATLAAGYATATTQAASMGPWAWIAFAATGLATLISTVSSIHDITGYAQGGIVQGNTFSGDQVGPVMLDAGEVVLNRSQVGNLAAQLEDNRNNAMGNSHPYVSGELIYLGLNNYLKRSGRGEIITSRG